MHGTITSIALAYGTQLLQLFLSLVSTTYGLCKDLRRLIWCHIGLYLTDVTFCREGNPSHRASPKEPEKKLINFNKYHKLARIVQGWNSLSPWLEFLTNTLYFLDMQRFQYSYNLKEIPEVQEYLKDAFEQSKNRTDLQDLYRRR